MVPIFLDMLSGGSWKLPPKHFLYCSSPARSDCTEGSG